ncbi:MAG: Foldase protein PrsA 1 [Candidatus Omnitrophica bacterium]|nr:Foldase protein PrsA 1 [Candidatus Omnitrophota bacterium]
MRNTPLRSFLYGIASVAALCLVLTSLGCQPASKSKVLARAGDQSVTQDEFMEQVRSLPKELRAIAIERKKEFLEDMLSERLLVREAEKRGVEKDPEVQHLMEAARRKILLAKLMEQEVDGKLQLGKDEARAYYDAHQEEFMTPLLLRASHILVKTEEEAHRIRQRVLDGESFEDLARAHSTDTTASRGGDIGFFQKGQLVREFEVAALALKPGDLGEVVRSSFGHHVIKLTDRLEPSLREFRAVRGAIEERLLNQKRSDLLKALIEKLKNDHKVQLDETALEALQLEPAQTAQGVK